METGGLCCYEGSLHDSSVWSIERLMIGSLVNGGLERIWKEGVSDLIEVLSWYLHKSD
jgi:hypothetical protein